MLKRLKNFVIELQNSDEAAKKRWLIILSGTSMLAVVGLWLAYFNWSLQKISPAPQQATTETSGLKETLAGFKSTLDNGLQAIKEQLGRTKSYDLKVAKVPPTPLP